jgi:hypothetical protein
MGLVGAAIGPGTGDISACALVVEDSNRAGPPRSGARPGVHRFVGSTWWWMSSIPTLMRSGWPRGCCPIPAASDCFMAILHLFYLIPYSKIQHQKHQRP